MERTTSMRSSKSAISTWVSNSPRAVAILRSLPGLRADRTAVACMAAIEALKSERLRLVPDRWNGVYLHWLENIRDWCISRQLWWGHRIPAWYDEAGNIYVGHDEKDVRQKYDLAEDLALREHQGVHAAQFHRIHFERFGRRAIPSRMSPLVLSASSSPVSRATASA